MKKNKVGLLLISHEWGGAQEVVYQLIKNLKAKKNAELYFFINNELLDYYNDIGGMSIYPLGPINRKNKFFVLYSYYQIRRNLIKILKTQPLDLVHIHLEGSLFVYFGLPDMFEAPVIFNLHGREIKDFLERRNIPIYWLVKNIFEKAKVIISPSYWQIEKLERKYKLKTIIIPNGVDTKEFKPLKVEKETNVILFVGRFIELKGILELVEVAKLLPEYDFWFAGQGPLAKFINLTNTKNLGFKTRSELVKLYNKATICCFPSHHENMPIVGLEALSCGKPIIATKLGFSEYIENKKDGLIVEAKSVRKLREAIILLMENQALRTKLGKNARKKALQYNWQEIVKKFYDLYKATVVQSNSLKAETARWFND